VQTTNYTPQYIALIQEFSAMKFGISGNVNGTSTNSTMSYVVTSSSGGVYDGNFNLTTGQTGQSEAVSFVVDANNDSVISVTISGYTFYGSEATSTFDSLMSLFGLQEYYEGNISVWTDSAYFHSTGTQTMTYGTTSFPVTTYEANSLPFTLDQCGVSATITAYSLEVGTPPGTSLQFITYIHFAGTTNGENEDITFQLLSMTVG